MRQPDKRSFRFKKRARINSALTLQPLKSGLLQGHVAGPEAIADTGADDDRVDIDMRGYRHIGTESCMRIGLKPKLLEVKVQEPVAGKLAIEASLDRRAPIVVELEARVNIPRLCPYALT